MFLSQWNSAWTAVLTGTAGRPVVTPTRPAQVVGCLKVGHFTLSFTDPRGVPSPRNEYDDGGRLVRQPRFDYDGDGHRTRTIFADGTFELMTYDAESRPLTITDRAGRVTRSLYDALGRRVGALFADGTTNGLAYDALGRLVASTDERSLVTRYEYDALCGCSRRVTNVIDPLGQETQFTYDVNGNQTAVRDALSLVTTLVYDANDRQVQTVFADGTGEQFIYDGLNRLIAQTDQAGLTTWFGYDARDRLLSVTNALGHVTDYAYDEVGNLLSQTDTEGRATRFEYDALGRRTQRTLPLNQSETYHYDLVGNLTALTDFNGRTTAYAYDALNRLTQRTPDAASDEPPVTFTYTATDRRADMTDASGVTAYAYDLRDRLTQKTWTPAGQAFNLSLAYTYDAAGNVASIRSASPNGADVGYEYDGLSRLVTANDARLGRTTFSYDAVGNLNGYVYPNGVLTTNQFDRLHRVTGVASVNDQLALINRYNYTLNASGKRLAVEEPGRRRVDYTYDNLYRLTREAITGAQGTLGVNYSYDAVGNRLTRDTQPYGYDDNDRVGGATYDANGNTVSALIQNPVSGIPNPVIDQYDFEDRLKNRNSGQITVVYDGDGNRVSKTVNGVTIYYLVDELNPSGYVQVLEELVALNAQPTTLNRVYSYDYALASQDQLLDDGQGNLRWVASFYGYDDHGSVRYLTDAAGNVTDLYDYDPFGNLIQQGGNTPNLYLYAGEQFDPDLQLYYLRARYLNPDTGRFWTRDPFEGFLDDPPSLNGYLYANSDPVNNWDPSGYESMAEVQQSSGISAQLRLTHQAPRLRKAAQASCRVVRTVDKAQNAYDTVQTARQLAAGVAAGAAAAGGLAGSGLSGSEIALLVIEEAFELRGLDVLRLRQFDLQEVLGSFDTPCFTAGTLVSTEQGLRPIETLKEGDRVWALGQGTVEVGLKPITKLFRHEVTNLVVLTVGGEVIETTPEHPFWMRDEGWVRAGQLEVGDELLTRDGAWLTITAVELRQGDFIVFNFEVGDFHSYYVGTDAISVHNARRFKTGDIGPWGLLSPGGNRLPGHSPSAADGRIQAHHFIQDEWGKRNIKGYDSSASRRAPSILLPTGTGRHHTRVSNAQRARGNTACAGDIRDQFQKAYRDLIDAGVSPKKAKHLASRAYKFFEDELKAFK